MARETREDRELREARERVAAEAAFEAYLLTVPKRLMDAQALAQSLGISVNVKLIETGPSVHFFDDGQGVDDTMTYQTEEWELEYLERKLQELKEAQEARQARVQLAQAAWKDKLNETERLALKENIHWMK